MVTREPLTRLLERMPGRSVDRLSEVDVDPCFTTFPSEIPNYVWPSVEIDEAELSSPVLLVKSAGAMGKTAAARAIAKRMMAPLVDLSKLRVGANSLTGLLTRVLGYSGAEKLATMLSSGQSILVLDGLDEAQLLAGRDNFISFVSDVARLASNPDVVGQIVAFGRQDAVETTFLSLLEANVQSSVVSLAPFSREQACELVDLTLDSHQGFTAHRTFRKSFAHLRDTQFADVARALSDQPINVNVDQDWGKLEHFLGYTPVVVALAMNLRIDNPEKELSALRRKPPEALRLQRGELLRSVIESILDREQAKATPKLLDAVGIDEPGSGVNFYTREEQCLRVVSEVARLDLSIPPPQSLSVKQKSVYEDHVRGFVHDHPFLRDREFANVVFRDYIRAYIATSPLASIHTDSQGTLLSACGGVGPLFCHFVQALTVPSSDASIAAAHRRGKVDESLIDDLIKSNSAGTPGEAFAMYNHRGESPFLLIGDFDSDEPTLIFDVVDATGILELGSPIFRMDVNTDHGVRLTANRGHLDIGPAVTIAAETIEIEGERLTCYPGSREGIPVGVVLVADETRHRADIAVAPHSPEDLRVWWPECSYQWRPYLMADPLPVGTELRRTAAPEVLAAIRRLLSGFRAKAQGPPSLYYEKYDNHVVGKNELLIAVKNALLATGVLQSTDEMYRLNLARLAEFEINYAGLNSKDWDKCLRRLAMELLKDAHVRQALRR